MIFSPSLRDVVGNDLHEDLLALGTLRNLFAHGRDLFLEFEDVFTGHASLDNNPIQASALRLHRVGVIKDLKITDQNYDKFQSAFYSDDALLYFYRAAEQIEDKLSKSVTFLPEKEMWSIPKLPALEA
jgi:hypothetical protein